jgi:hypothetical protein
MEYVAMRPDRLIKWRPRVAGRRRHRIVIGPGRHLKPWGGLRGLARTLESLTIESGSSGGAGNNLLESGGLGGGRRPCSYR